MELCCLYSHPLFSHMTLHPPWWPKDHPAYFEARKELDLVTNAKITAENAETDTQGKHNEYHLQLLNKQNIEL